MAESSTTKRALAAAMRDLMRTTPFAKISVGDICNVCQMNRKSFYYHFKDKYDLVNWIFDTEFLAVVQGQEYMNTWSFAEAICDYLYDSRDFYRKALRIEGQNSFANHFHEVLEAMMKASLSGEWLDEEAATFFTAFFTDAFCSSVTRWLTSREPMPTEKFLHLLQSSFTEIARRVEQREEHTATAVETA